MPPPECGGVKSVVIVSPRCHLMSTGVNQTDCLFAPFRDPHHSLGGLGATVFPFCVELWLGNMSHPLKQL